MLLPPHTTRRLSEKNYAPTSLITALLGKLWSDYSTNVWPLSTEQYYSVLFPEHESLLFLRVGDAEVVPVRVPFLS